MPLSRKPLSLAVSLALSAMWAHAAAQEASPDTPLMTVIVVGSQPADVDLNSVTLDADALLPMRAATSDTAALLRDIPGVSVTGAGGVSSLPSIRGLADDRLRIKVDGMDLIAACPNHMNPALSYIDPTRVDSIKVYAGITPVSVGGDSIGGTILVESAKPLFAKPGEGVLTQGEFGAFYRSNGDAMGANLSATLAGENLSVTYTGSTAQSDNYTAGDDFKTTTATGRPGHTLPLDEVGSTAYKSINHALGFALRNDGHVFDLKLAHQKVPYENFPNQRMDMTDNTSNQVNLGYTGDYQWGTLKARVYHETTEHEMDFGDDKRFWYGSASNSPVPGTPCSPLGPSCAAGMPMDTEGKTTGMSVNAELPLSARDTLRVGTEFQAYRLDDWWTASGAMMWPGTFLNINDGQRDRYAVFGEWEAKINPQWTSLLGLRHETVRMDAGDVTGYKTALATAPMPGMDVGSQIADAAAFNALDRDTTDRNWDLTALARYEPNTTHAYEIGVAQKTRSPNLYERYTWSSWTMAAVMNNFVGDGNGYVGNLDLEPEVARTLSFAADWHDAGKKSWGVRVAPYYTHVQDYIDATCNTASCPDDQFNVLKYVNQSARLLGVDLSGHFLAARSAAYGDFTVRGVVNYTRGENRDTGDKLYNIMPLNAKLALTQKRGRLTNTLEGQFVAAKNDVSDIRNEIETAGYSLFNLRSSYEWKQVRLDVGIDNLFDKGYALPLGGAYVGQGTTMSINGVPWGIAVPGPGRSFYAGLNVKF
ncbi:MAG TPA: TonB-dependent receptor [Thiobacillus sp.]|nr:MAG: TonB-dependent receptor [Hydrogenophilales bacterium 16-64-40]OZA33504.1 MAG: TonB-dependent receptor [Hydrogenophilales bacterium 17-64-65]HQS82576.1 TonB-dependent receptor [Thiobacillus sp.]HQT32586.1 TonB-dependent receptor [Thiobacillus sp.]